MTRSPTLTKTALTMPGSEVPVIRQPFAAGDPLPYWAYGTQPRNLLYELADDPDVGATWLARRATMLAEQVDVTAGYLDLVDLVVARHR